MMSTRRCTRCARALVLCVLAALSACSRLAEEAPYVAPRPGTVFHYRGMENRITGSQGWRTTFVDGLGREGLRWAVFIPDDARHPAEIDSAELARLWPLKVGNEAVVRVKHGPEVYRWEFRVGWKGSITVPAGRYDTYMVQAVQQPELVRDPRTAYTAMYTWWYAPAVPGVVRFITKYVGGPAAGRVIASELEKLDAPAPAPAAAGTP